VESVVYLSLSLDNAKICRNCLTICCKLYEAPSLCTWNFSLMSQKIEKKIVSILLLHSQVHTRYTI
jgi:hypothetical protein